MSLLSIIEVPDPILRASSDPVERFDSDLEGLVNDMLETMYAAPGIGLAGVQVAVPRRLLVIDLQDPEEEGGEPVKTPQAFINPEILWSSDERSIYNEGCLSIPDQYAEVERPARIRAKWQDVNGKSHEKEFDGLMATCLQHEVDHLNGVLFIDYLSRLKRDMVLKKVAKLRRAL
ncbi:peptide deformylase [Allosphingosinicella indica]|uniref:Peptide deformylase n=1 Tax=Allosphingosinicella indica TaxID=941907 RepID=A0A1X7GVU9_9SPHN|nr:peptide deformylase [Allosphingosinicella indica]SMF75543.1 peptide deformylase [Allosphingosinicella indica]